MALGDRRRPTLPVGVERGKFVDAVQQVVAGQDLGTPGRSARTGGEERDFRLPRGEGAVEGGEIGDLQGHDQQTDTRGDDLDRPGPRSRVGDDSEGEDGGARNLESGTQALSAGPPGDQSEPEDERAQPQDEQRDHGGRAHERHEPIAHLVGREVGQDAAGRPADAAGHGAHGARRAHPGHDQRGERAEGSGPEDEHADDQPGHPEERLHHVILPCRIRPPMGAEGPRAKC